MKFNVGDVVRLKSGGPEMTVFNVSEGSTRPIYCSWFNGSTILHHGDDNKLTGFKPEMLDLVRSATTANPDSPKSETLHLSSDSAEAFQAAEAAMVRVSTAMNEWRQLRRHYDLLVGAKHPVL